ncbi:MAG: penicillin acylase family protein, partial [Chloroflexales bacterium]|nr:penicillin acylase family protein [Chloroflexales bacterium]
MFRYRFHIVQLLVLLALVVGATGAAYAAPLQTNDALVLKSPYGRVSIARNAEGVPHIRARGEHGAQFGLGYA